MRIDDEVLDSPAAAGARVLALGLLEEADRAAEGLARGGDPEALHDFRVALRRLRSALRAFRPWLRDAVRRKHEKRLRKVGRATSRARDAEVQLAWLEARREALSGSRRAGVALLVERLEARRRVPDVPRVIRRYRRAAGRLRRRLARPRSRGAGEEGRRLGDAAAALLGEELQELRHLLSRIRDANDARGVHEARIAGKRLRYLLEPLRGSRRLEAAGAVKRLKRLQDVLGDLHDAHVLGDVLEAALVEAAGDRARALLAATSGASGEPGAFRAALRGSPLPGMLALARLLRERREALFAELERGWRAGGLDPLARDVEGIAAALEGRPLAPSVSGAARAATS